MVPSKTTFKNISTLQEIGRSSVPAAVLPVVHDGAREDKGEGVGASEARSTDFSALITDYATMTGSSDRKVRTVFAGKVGQRVENMLRFDRHKRLSNVVLGGLDCPIAYNDATVWSDELDCEVPARSVGETAMVPAGRAAQNPFDLVFYTPFGCNTQMGRFGLKAQAAYAAEMQNFDAAFHRMARRDKDDRLSWVFARVVKNGMPWLSWAVESLCESYLPRALQRNMLLAARTEQIDVRAGELEVHHTAEGLDRGQAPFAGGSDLLVSVVCADELALGENANLFVDMKDTSFVSQARGANELVTDLFSMWCGNLAEVGLLRDHSLWVIPQFTRAEMQGYFSKWGLRLESGRLLDVSATVHWLTSMRVYPNVGTLEVTQGDALRVVELSAIRRFRFQAEGRWYDLTSMEGVGGEASLNFPIADVVVRVASALGVIESVEGTSTVPNWRNVEEVSWWKALTIGSLGDFTQQVTIGHWMNAGFFSEGEIFHDRAEQWMNLLCSVGFTQKGVTWLGVYWSLPHFNEAERYGGNYLPDVGGAEVAIGGLRYDVRPGGDDGVEGREDEFGGVFGIGYSGTVLQPDNRNEVVPVWLVMTRANWASLLGSGLGDTIVSGRRRFVWDAAARGMGRDLDFDGSVKDEYIAEVYSRALVQDRFPAVLVLRQGATMRGSSPTIVRSCGRGDYLCEVYSPLELLRFGGRSIQLLGGHFSALAALPEFSVYGSGRETATPAGFDSYF